MKIAKLSTLANEIIAGARLRPEDDLSLLLEAPLEELQAAAGEVQRFFCGNHVDLCTILNGRSGRCSENCKYCAQAACHHTGIEEYPFLSTEKIIENARANQRAGVNRFAIVTSGRALQGKEFDMAIGAYEKMHGTLTIDLCASHGIIGREQFHRLRKAGVTSYHHNIEPPRRFFPHICTTHTYEDRIRTIRIAQEEGNPLPHFLASLVGESEAQYLLSLCQPLTHNSGNPGSHGVGFPRSSRCSQQYVLLQRLHYSFLFSI